MTNKKEPFLHRLFVVLILIMIGLAIDIVTKHLASSYLKDGTIIEIIPGFFRLNYLENTGAAFGMLQDHPWIFNTISIIALALMLPFVLLTRDLNKPTIISLSLIISGGIANMIERLSNGFVVDFLDFYLINFAIFNVADSLVTVGSFLLIFSLIFEMIRDSKGKKES